MSDESRAVRSPWTTRQLLSRRRLLGFMAAGAASATLVPLLAACGGDDDEEPTAAPGGAATSTPSSGQASPTQSSAASPASTAMPGTTTAGGGGTLRIGLGALPKTADPNFDTSLFANPFYRLVYDTLVETDEGDPTPALAASWEVIDDLTWEIKLQQGVKFHSGEDFNADAVKWNIDHILDETVKSQRIGRVSRIESVEIVDPYTVRIKTKEPWATLLKNMTYIGMLAPADFQQKGQEEFNRNPSGTGPFSVVEWRQDELIALKGFTSYWRGAPKLDGIEMRLMPEDASRISSLEAGESDLVYALPPEQVPRLKDSGFSIFTNPIGHSFIIVLRSTVGGPLEDVRVRQAINYAVDKDLIIEELIGGIATKLDGQLVGQDAFGYNPDVAAYPYDPDKAKQLLTDAGYPDGFSVVFEGSQGRYIKDKEVEEAVAQQLAEVGIDAKLQILESGVWLDKWFGSTYAPLFDVAILYAPPMDLEAALPSFVPAASTIKAADDPKLNDLYARQASTLDDQERLTILHEIAAYFNEQAFALTLFQVPNIAGVSSKVAQIDFRADYSIKDPLQVTIEG